MAPPKTRGVPEDSKFDVSSAREKPTAGALLSGTGKGRRTANSTVVASSTLKDVTTAHATVEEPVGQQSGSEATGGAYRHTHRLNTPSAFISARNRMILTGPGLGRYSPTMALRKDRRRVDKDHLALAVRKDFNAAGISEHDVVASFIYSVYNQG
ncbi:MAG: hypothetical protein Q9187_000661 [Circinaria calcarea]